MRYAFDDPDTFDPMDDYIHKSDLKYLDNVKDFAEGIYEAAYSTGDIDHLLFCLDELMHLVDASQKDGYCSNDAQIIKKPTPVKE
jgi:hypothetical protein